LLRFLIIWQVPANKNADIYLSEIFPKIILVALISYSYFCTKQGVWH